MHRFPAIFEPNTICIIEPGKKGAIEYGNLFQHFFARMAYPDLGLDLLLMTQAFQQNETFPDLGLDLLSIGKNTGAFESSIRKVFKFYHLALLDHLSVLRTAVTATAIGTAFAIVTMWALSVITSGLKKTCSMHM
jgi:hypothetical protein